MGLYAPLTTLMSSASGTELDVAHRHGNVSPPFGRSSVNTFCMAISIFEPDSGFIVVAFLVLDFATV